MEKNMVICQSCSMPMDKTELFGTEKDGSLSKEFCIHCYIDGSFTHPDATLDSMIEAYAPQWGKWTNRPTMTLEEAKIEIREKLSPLKRWKAQQPRKRCCCCR